MKRFDTKQKWLLVLPVALTVSCSAVFYFLSQQLGNKEGYIIGFIFYWIGWCTIGSIFIAGRKNILTLFRVSTKFDLPIILCLLIPLIFVYSYVFPMAIKKADPLIITLSLLISFVNATAEEILWRGVYLRIFENRQSAGIIISSVGFAVWHYAPQIIFPNQHAGGAHSFVAFAFALGLSYAYIARKQQSILWTVIAHILFDFAGLGARIYFQ